MALEDSNALALIRLANELQTEPHKFCGFVGICDWLDQEKQPFGFKKIARDLELKFHNLKLLPSQRPLLALQRKITGGGR